MIERTRAAEPPDFRGQDEPLHRVAMRPPAVPKFSHIRARRLWIDGKIRRLEKSGDAEQHRFDVVILFSKERERQPLRQKGEREFVLFVTERSRNLLEERGVAAVGGDEVLHSRGLALEAELRRCGENAREALLRQIFQRRLTSARSRERHV